MAPSQPPTWPCIFCGSQTDGYACSLCRAPDKVPVSAPSLMPLLGRLYLRVQEVRRSSGRSPR